MPERNNLCEPGGRREFLSAALAAGSLAAINASPASLAQAEQTQPLASDIDHLLSMAQQEYPDRLTTEEWAIVRKQIADNQQAAANLARVPLDWTQLPIFFPSMVFDHDVAQ